MITLVVGQLQGAPQSRRHLTRRRGRPALLKAYEVVDGDPGQCGDFLAA
jgi:hypothetical protein